MTSAVSLARLRKGRPSAFYGTDFTETAMPKQHTQPSPRAPWIKTVAYACQCGALLAPATPEEETEILRETPCCRRHGYDVLTETSVLVRGPLDD